MILPFPNTMRLRKLTSEAFFLRQRPAMCKKKLSRLALVRCCHVEAAAAARPQGRSTPDTELSNKAASRKASSISPSNSATQQREQTGPAGPVAAQSSAPCLAADAAPTSTCSRPGRTADAAGPPLPPPAWRDCASGVGKTSVSKQTVFDRLCALDAACCRLVNYRNSWREAVSAGGAVSAATLLQALGRGLAGQLWSLHGLRVEGGVFSQEDDEFWFFSMGEDVDVRFGAGGAKTVTSVQLAEAAQLIEQTVWRLQCMMSPEQVWGDFMLSDTKDRGITVLAARDLPADTLVSTYHGYYRHMTEGSNEHYNAVVAHSEGSITIDPTLDSDQVCLEFACVFAPRTNEPCPGQETNCKWKMRRQHAPQIFLSRAVSKGQELFIFYGHGYDVVRNYPIADGLTYEEFGDVDQEDTTTTATTTATTTTTTITTTAAATATSTTKHTG
eukprot:g41750.t1